MKVKSNRAAVRRSAQRAFQRTAQAFSDKNQEVIREPRFWKGFENSTTYRQNGEVVQGAFRNIADSYDLANSQTLTFQGDNASLTWGSSGETPVQAVYFGHRSEDSFTPGRRWTEVARNELDLSFTFKYYFH